MARLVSRSARLVFSPREACSLWLAVVATAFAPVSSSAVSGDYLIDVWTSEHGLLNSSVTAITQTRDGYLWVGTYNGLFRFNGVGFLWFEPSNTPALQRARVRRLFPDPNGGLWINTYDGSLTLYRDGHFSLEWRGDGSADSTVSLVSMRSSGPTFLLHTGELIRRLPDATGTNRWQVLRPPGANLGQICVEDNEGVIWVRRRAAPLLRLVGDQFKELPRDAGPRGADVNYLTADRNGRIWAGTEQEIALWEDGRFRTMTPTNGEPVLDVNYIHATREGELWIVANGRVRKASGREWVFEAEACRGLFTGWMDRLGIKEDRNGGAWIYHYGNGIFHIRPDGRVRQLATEEDFPGYKVDCFHEDREGNLWAGVDRGGLVRIREQHFTVLAPGDPAFAKSAVSVAEDSEGALWVGTFGSGLYRVLDDTWRSIPLPIGSGREFVFSVFPDKNGRVWVSAGGEDLYVGTNGNFKPASPPVHGVKALLPASDGRLWIGTKSGLCCLSDEGFRQFTPEDGVKRLDVRALAEDSNGVIWAGAGDGTLYRIESDSITSHSPDDDLTGQPIWSLLADDDGTIWVGTFRGGLMRFRDGKFVRYTEKNGLPDDVICQILDGGDGCLWIGSQRGIFRVPKWELESFTTRSNKSISCTAYGRFDGLPSVECSGSYQPAAWRASDGRLLFTTLKGVVSVLPEELNPNRLPPPVVIEEVLLDGRAARIETKTQDDEEVRMLDVPPGQRQLEVRFTALSFVSPDRVRFRYKLDGMDSQWNEAGGRRSVNYNFLKPGRYMFHVTACNNDGVWNDLGTTLAIHVLPQWYQQWWFLPMISAVALVMVSVGVRQVVMRRVRGELQRVERQRAVELDRARIAKDIHDDLGAGLTHITLLSEVARRSPLDNVHGHLNHISDMARELTRAMDETVWAVNPKNDSLEGLMTYVTKFAQEYLNVAGIRCRLDLPAQLPPYTLDAELRHNVYLAIKETLNNVVKHAHASEVWLRLSFQRHGFSLVLEDDGCGLPTAGKPSDTQIGRISTGHGLSNLQKRLSASGGRCVITSEPGKGTRVEFIVEGVAAAGLARNGD